MIPAISGYGFVTPVTKAGRFIVVIYALIGAPLVLVTMSDIGKFLSFYLMRFLPEVRASNELQ